VGREKRRAIPGPDAPPRPDRPQYNQWIIIGELWRLSHWRRVFFVYVAVSDERWARAAFAGVHISRPTWPSHRSDPEYPAIIKLPRDSANMASTLEKIGYCYGNGGCELKATIRFTISSISFSISKQFVKNFLIIYDCCKLTLFFNKFIKISKMRVSMVIK